MVTLSDINITPLLDLAFVLLIIFVITTPLLEQSMNLKLPRVGKKENQLEKKDISTVESPNTGYYRLDRQAPPTAADYLAARQDYRANPNILVYIRAVKMAGTTSGGRD